jgi:hypothetical protein
MLVDRIEDRSGSLSQQQKRHRRERLRGRTVSPSCWSLLIEATAIPTIIEMSEHSRLAWADLFADQSSTQFPLSHSSSLSGDKFKSIVKLMKA